MAAEAKFKVQVRYKDPKPAKVSITILGDTAHGDPTEATGTHTLRSNNLPQQWYTGSFDVNQNSTVWDILQLVTIDTNGKISFSNPSGNYVDYVTYNRLKLGEFTNGKLSGWMYTLNGTHPNLGVSEQFLNPGDRIIFHYTDDYTIEEGSDKWGTPGADEVKDVTTSGTSGSATTTSPTEVKMSGTTATVTVKADNQKEILKQAKEKKSAEVVLTVAETDSKGAEKYALNLDKSFIQSLIKDTTAKLVVKTPIGQKTYDREALQKLLDEATTAVIKAEINKDNLDRQVEEPTVDVKALTAKLTPVARSAKTAKKNVKVTVSLDKQDKAIIKELKDAGYTVKYRFYRSTKKAAGYKAAVTKKTASYTNTGGKKGTKYFYKVQVRVYDENGKLAAKTALKQCKYASRTWTKGK